MSLIDTNNNHNHNHNMKLMIPSYIYQEQLKQVIPMHHIDHVISCYVHDRVGVPCDLQLAVARYLRSHLSWAKHNFIQCLRLKILYDESCRRNTLFFL
jgi:hypothetical protein